MFPNNIDFFVREKEAERQAEIEHIRLTRHLKTESWLKLMRCKMGRILYGLGSHLVNWGEKLQVQPPVVIAEPSEGSIS